MKKNSMKILMGEENTNFYAWSMIADGFLSPNLKKYTGMDLSSAIMIFNQDKGEWAVDPMNWNEIGKCVMKRIETKKLDAKKLLNEHKRLGKKIVTLCDRIEKAGIKKLSNKKICQWLKVAWKDYLHLNTLGFVAVASDFMHLYLSSKLLEILLKRNINEEKAQEYLSVLSSMNIPTLNWSEELELLRLAKKYGDFKKLRESEEFKRHIQKYFWINYGYQGPSWKSKDFLKRAKRMLNQKNALNKHLVEHQKSLRELNREQSTIEKILKLSSDEKKWFETARTFMYLKAYRMEVRHRVNYISEEIFKVISGRMKIAPGVFRYALRGEILDILQGKSVQKYILDRQKRLLYVTEKGKTWFVRQSKIKSYLNTILVSEENITGDSVSGNVAFKGKVKGKVRIIYGPKDNKKVKRGDIIVTQVTTPDLLPAMIRAGAFVTDTGGITSHASIVARELKKPCVIGTQIATKIFKDGDMVEVDAEKGIVKKIR